MWGYIGNLGSAWLSYKFDKKGEKKNEKESVILFGSWSCRIYFNI